MANAIKPGWATQDQDGGDPRVPTPHPRHPRPYGFGGDSVWDFGGDSVRDFGEMVRGVALIRFLLFATIWRGRRRRWWRRSRVRVGRVSRCSGWLFYHLLP
jgi:hypothetical protein